MARKVIFFSGRKCIENEAKMICKLVYSLKLTTVHRQAPPLPFPPPPLLHLSIHWVFVGEKSMKTIGTKTITTTESMSCPILPYLSHFLLNRLLFQTPFPLGSFSWFCSKLHVVTNFLQCYHSLRWSFMANGKKTVQLGIICFSSLN